MYAAAQNMPAAGRSLKGTQIGATATGEMGMLETIVVILLILWVLGLVSSYTMGGLIHILLVVAVVVILLRVIKGRRA